MIYKQDKFFFMPIPLSFSTPRLHIRPLTLADFDFYFSLQRDAELMRHIRPPETDQEVVKARMETMLKYAAENPGLGPIVAELNTTGQVVGSGVLRHIDYQPGQELELGYLVVREFWGQGFATEITQGLARFAFENFGVDQVTAVVAPENMASQQVLLKSGFRLVGRRFIYDSDNLEFVLDNNL